MSKLDVIILKYGNAVLDLPKTNDPIGKPLDEAKQEIEGLIKQLYQEALDMHNHTGLSLTSAFNQLVDEL